MAEDIPNKLNELYLTQAADYVTSLWTNYQIATTSYRARLNDFYKQYRGIPNRKGYDGLANVVINETLSAVESIVAQEFHSLFSESKYLMFKPREETDEQNAILSESLIHYYLDIMDLESKVADHLRQRGKYGTTVGKVSWEYEKDNVNNKVKKSKPKLELIDLLDCAFDVGIGDIENMPWFIVRKRMTKDDILEHQRRTVYSKMQVEKLFISKGGKQSFEFLNNMKQRLLSAGIMYYIMDQSIIEIYEFWGKVPRLWVDEDISPESDEAQELVPAVIEVSETKITIRMERNRHSHQEIPILLDQYIKVDGEGFGLGICEISEYLQQELNDKRNQSLDHASLQIFPPIGINKNAQIEDKEIKLQPHQKIHTQGDPRAAISPIALGGNYIENVTMDGIIKQDIRNVSGATNPVQGIPSSKESTAYEINVLQQRGSSRINVSTVTFANRFLKRAYRLIFSDMKDNVDLPTAIRIVGKNGVKWTEITRQNLDIDVDIVPKISTDLDSRTIVRSQMIQFLTQLASFSPRMNVNKIVRKVYELFGFDDVDEVVPEPDFEKGQSNISDEEEFQVLSLGQNIDVKYYEDHMNKLLSLYAFLDSNRNNLSSQAVESFNNKIQQHMKYLQNLEQMAKSLAGANIQPPTGPGQAEKTGTQTPVSAFSEIAGGIR